MDLLWNGKETYLIGILSNLFAAAISYWTAHKRLFDTILFYRRNDFDDVYDDDNVDEDNNNNK
jgi:hypothetical protein